MTAALPYKREFSKVSIRHIVVPNAENVNVSETKTRFSCIAEVHKSTRRRIEFIKKRSMEDTVEGKEFNFVIHYNLVHKFISILQRMNIPDAKTAVIMEWKNP